jgi:hypothetical protein
VRTPDENGGKKAKCPKCKGTITIPAAGSYTAASQPQPATEIATIQPSDLNAPVGLGNIKFCEDIEPDYEKKWYTFLIPTYDELSLFLASVALILLLIGNSEMRTFLWAIITDDIRNIALLIILFLSMCMCLYQPFIIRKKNPAEKYLMLFFAVLVNGAGGIIAGNYMLEHTVGWLAIFPAWNIINGIILLAMFRYKFIDYRSISDRDTNAPEVILGLVVIIAIYIICNFVYKQYWAITLSICLAYSTSLSKSLRMAFPSQQRITTTEQSDRAKDNHIGKCA